MTPEGLPVVAFAHSRVVMVNEAHNGALHCVTLKITRSPPVTLTTDTITGLAGLLMIIHETCTVIHNGETAPGRQRDHRARPGAAVEHRRAGVAHQRDRAADEEPADGGAARADPQRRTRADREPARWQPATVAYGPETPSVRTDARDVRAHVRGSFAPGRCPSQGSEREARVHLRLVRDRAGRSHERHRSVRRRRTRLGRAERGDPRCGGAAWSGGHAGRLDRR